MVHITNYAFQNDLDAKARLANGTVQMAPDFWGGWIAIFRPHEGPKKSGFYSVYWFAGRTGKVIGKALVVTENTITQS